MDKYISENQNGIPSRCILENLFKKKGSEVLC
jgi:hypothetical protein